MQRLLLVRLNLYTIKAERVRICMDMIKDLKQLFAELIKAPELRKVDFKSDQYRLDDQSLKSKFDKDILCMANAAGGDGYALLGVKSEKGKPQGPEKDTAFSGNTSFTQDALRDMRHPFKRGIPSISA